MVFDFFKLVQDVNLKYLGPQGSMTHVNLLDI